MGEVEARRQVKVSETEVGGIVCTQNDAETGIILFFGRIFGVGDPNNNSEVYLSCTRFSSGMHT